MWSRPVLWAAAAASVVALSVGVLQLAAHPPVSTPGGPGLSSAPSTPSTPPVSLDLDAPTVVFRPTDPGWQLAGMGRNTGTFDAHTTFGFLHRDGRRFTLALYPPGARTQGSVLRADEQLTVRGQPAFATDEGPPRYRLDWDEAGLQWEVDGQPFTSLAELIATLDGFAVVDRATWEAWMPADVLAALRDHPGETVQWGRGRPVEVRPPSDPPEGVESIPSATR
jgi:hypothetical protein